MKRMICAILAVAILLLIAPLARAGRLEDMQAKYAELAAEKRRIETEMIRLEGMFMERQAIMTEQKVEALVEEQQEAEEQEGAEETEEEIEAEEEEKPKS